MSTEPVSGRSPVIERYLGASRAEPKALTLVTDLSRDPVSVHATVRDPVPLREALSVLHEIVRSDLTYRPRDRSDYLRYRRMRKRSNRMSEDAARQEYFAWISRNDPQSWFVLDPVITVAPDALVFEVFSKDESTYAQLSVSRDALEVHGDWLCGTTNVDFTDALYAGLQRIRSDTALTLQIGPEVVSVHTQGSTVTEKHISLPDAWLRGFLQVQSAIALAGPEIVLSPVQLYNIMRQLRLSADRRPKGSRRGGRALRVELVPGETPRLVLEPWEQVFDSVSPYRGPRREVVRVWGRRRWLLARRLLPLVDRASLHVIGSGLPSFLVLRAGPLTLTLGLTGFIASDWTRMLQLDALLPRPSGEVASELLQRRVLGSLAQRRSTSVRDLSAELRLPEPSVRALLQAFGQHGLVMFDLANDRVHLRSLTANAVPEDRLRFRNDREREAIDLLAAHAVQIVSEERRFGEGLQLVADIVSAVDSRTYRTSITLDEEERVRKADCTCNTHRMHGLKEGPCAHLVALTLAQRLPEHRTAAIETRTFARRVGAAESITQLSLDKRRLKTRFGLRTDERLRVTSVIFDTEAAAQEAYRARLAELASAGWIDADLVARRE